MNKNEPIEPERPAVSGAVTGSANPGWVYDVLIAECGAAVGDRNAFVQEMQSDTPTREWRFQGRLGFGGKYWPLEKRVSCYREDETPERRAMMDRCNEVLRGGDSPNK